MRLFDYMRLIYHISIPLSRKNIYLPLEMEYRIQNGHFANGQEIEDRKEK